MNYGYTWDPLKYLKVNFSIVDDLGNLEFKYTQVDLNMTSDQ